MRIPSSEGVTFIDCDKAKLGAVINDNLGYSCTGYKFKNVPEPCEHCSIRERFVIKSKTRKKKVKSIRFPKT